MPERSAPPTFSALRADPAYADLPAEAKRDALLKLRDLHRHEARRAGVLDSLASDIDSEAYSAARAAGVELQPGSLSYPDSPVQRSVNEFARSTGNDLVRGVAGIRRVWNSQGVLGARDTEDLAGIERTLRDTPQTLGARDFDSAPTAGDAIRENGLGSLWHGGIESAVPSILIAGTGMAGGAAAGALTANPAGIAAGAAAGAGAGSGLLERQNRLMDKLAASGVDTTDKTALDAAFADEALISRLEREATLEAAPTALADGIAGGLPLLGAGARTGRALTRTALAKALAEGGGIAAARAAARAPLARAAATAAEYGVEQSMQGALGAAGSIGSDLVAGESPDLKAAFLEAGGEFLNPLEVIGAHRLLKYANRKTSPSPVTSPEAPASQSAIRSPQSPESSPSPVTSVPSSEFRVPSSDASDLLGTADIERARAAEADAAARAGKLAALRSDYLGVFKRELEQRSDAVRERGGEGDAFLSAVEQELTRIRDDQSGDRRGAALPDIRKVVARVLPESAGPDTIDTLALELHGADASSSRANLSAALDRVRDARSRAFEADAPARARREAAERERAKVEEERKARDAADAARLDAEHAAELARLDAARVTPSGSLDLAKWTDDDLAAFAHGDPDTGLFDRKRFAATRDEAERRQSADPDYAEKPLGTLMRTWRDDAAAELDRRMQADSSAADLGPSVRDLLLKGKIQLPTESSTYSGELAAFREQLTPAERLRVFRKVPDGEAGDRMLERLAERLTVDDGHSYLESSGANLLDALSRSASGEHLRPDWRNDGVRFSRQATLDLGAQGIGYELPRTIRNLTPRWNARELVFRSSLDKAVYYATSGEPSSHRTAILDHVATATGTGRGVIAAMGRALRERIAAESSRSGESITVPETSPRILLERDGVFYSRTGVDSRLRSETLPSHDAKALQDAAHATAAFRRFGELGPEESLVPVELRKGRHSRELADQIRGSRAIAKKFGHEVVLFQAPAGFPADGFVLRDRPGVIFLNVNAHRPVLAVTGHELMHSMEATAPRLAEAVRDALADYRRHYHVYEAFSRRDGYAPEQVGREFAADVLGDTLLRQTFLDRLAAKAPRVFAEFIRFARNFVTSVKARLKASELRDGVKPVPGYGTANFLHHLDAVDEILARALVKWRARLRSGQIGDADIGVRNLEDPALRPFKYPANNDGSRSSEPAPVLMSRRPQRSFSESLDEWKEGRLDPRDLVQVGETPSPLILAGADARPLGMLANVFHKFTAENKHALPAELLRGLPEALERPLAVFQSRSESDALTVLTNIDAGGRKLLAAVHLDKQVRRAVINDIASVYDKDTGTLHQWVKDGLLRYADPKQNPDFMKKIGILGDESAPLFVRLQLPLKERSRYHQRTIYGPHDLPQADSGEISMSRRPRAARPLSVADAQSALDAAKADRDKLRNNPDDVNWRRAEAKVTAARNALTEARSRETAQPPVPSSVFRIPSSDALPLAEPERDAAARRLAAAQANLAALQAAGKKVGGESYKDTPAYKNALAERDAAFAAITELAKPAPSARSDKLAELSAERERLFRELHEAQLPDDERAAKQTRLAELNRALKASESDAGARASTPASWSVESFSASAWADRILSAENPGDIPAPAHFRALSDNALGELITELKNSRDADNSRRLDAVLANLEALVRDRRTRGALPSPSPVSTQERSRTKAEAEAVLADAERRIKESRDAREQRRRDMTGDRDDWQRDLGNEPTAVPSDEFVPTDAAARAISDDTHPEDILPSEPTEEDIEALRALDSIVQASTAPLHPLDRQAVQADRDAAAREAAASAGDNLPPSKQRPLDGSGEYAPRMDSPVHKLPGVTTEATPAWKGVFRGLGEWFAGFRSILPEVPTNAWHLKGVVEGYKALLRGQEVAVYDAEKEVAHILEPLMALDNPVDPAARKRLHALRIEQVRLDKELAEATTKPGFLERQKALNARLAELHRQAKAEADSMADQPLAIYENFILWRDLMHRALTLSRDNGEPIALPYGINAAEATAEAERWAERLKASPHRAALLEAVRRHESTVSATWEDFKRRALPIEGVWNGGKAYYPHIHPEHSTGRPDRVGRTAADDFRAYLTNPVGSTKAIETDYAKAMFLHLASVHANNLHQDVVRNHFAPLDQTAELETERAALRAAGKDVPALEAMARSRGLVQYSPDDGMRFALMPVIDREKLGRAIGRVLDDSPLADQLEALAKDGIRVRPEHIREQLAVIGKDAWWVRPEAKDALSAIERQEAPDKNMQLVRAAEFVNRNWKKYVLFFPHNYLRYEFNNTVSDTGKLAAVDPRALKGVPNAFTEVRKFFRGEEVSADTAAAFRLGVFDCPTAKEIEDLRDVPAFDAKLHTDGEKLMRRILGWAGKDWHKFSAYREATYRLAKFNADLARLRAGETPVYGGAYWKDIETIGDSAPGAGDRAVRRAAAISLATMNDYAAISRSGAQLRRYLVPFWSFTENNLRYHLNLARNLWDMTARGEMTRAEALRAGAGSAASLTARAALGIASRVAFPLLALALYNAAVGGEDELSDEDRRRLHLNLGRDEDGRVRVLYLENDFVAFLRWFGGNRALANALAVAKGDTSLATAAKDWASNIHKDFAQTAFSVGPIPRSIALVAADREIGMDILNPRTVHGKDKVWSLVKEAVGVVPSDVLRSALDKDYYSNASLADWLQQTILQVRRRDPEQWAYYSLREKADDFREDKTGKASERGAYSAPEAVALRSFRRAIFKGDIPAALNLYDSLLRYGYTADRLQSSLRSADPLAGLPKSGPGNRREFIDSLSASERRDLDRAFLYAERFRSLDGKARQLFPAKSDNSEVMQRRLDTFASDPSRRDRLRLTLEEQAAQDADARRLDAELARRKSLANTR